MQQWRFAFIDNVLSAVSQSMSIEIINAHLHNEPTYRLLKIPTLIHRSTHVI